MAARRTLTFTSYSEVIKEIESLQKNGYKQGKNWNLGQICRHLAYYYKGALDGFPKMLPWIIRVTIGKLSLKQVLSKAESKEDSQTDPKSVFPPEPDEKLAIEEALLLLKRLEQNTSPLHPSGFFGDLTNDQWKILNLGHASHHLSFLHPLSPEK
jgi:hypothetical protein